MPYITQEDRGALVHGFSMQSRAGDLNYMFTLLIQAYVRQKGECYQTYNDVIGALEGCKLELYRRKIADYETKKCEENGDVY